MDIQHKLEILKRSKATHEPLIKALFSFENMESHGESIKPIFCQLIIWTPPKGGLHYYSSLVVLVQVSKPYYSQGWWFEGIST
jgi:hypothetical protein